MNVGIDSMVLIYAGAVPKKDKGKQPAQQTDLSVRARLLLHMHRDDTIILPTIVVSELLIPVPVAQKGPLSAVLAKRFLCAPFDLKAASIASSLWAEHKKLPQNLQYKNRTLLKSDVLIIGAVISAGGTRFYSHDKKCRALADKVLDARDLPKSDPDDMFAVEDIKRGDL